MPSNCYCFECKQPLTEIDSHGRLLVGCMNCNIWWAMRGASSSRLSAAELRSIIKGKLEHRKRVGRFCLGSIAICFSMLSLIACSSRPPNFVAIDPAKQSDSWALQRADIDCKALVGSQRWGYRWRVRYRADPAYVSCMQQKGFVEAPT